MPEIPMPIALVTGASGGLGERFARNLASDGYRTILVARRTDLIEKLADELRVNGSDALALAGDVSKEEDVIRLFDNAETHFGAPVSIVVNNAGISEEGLATDLSVEAFDKILAVNVRGVFLCAREAARRLITAGQEAAARGRIVNIASIGGQKVLPGLTAYCTSKAAVLMLTRSLAREWTRHRINVNAICPGYIETDINADWFATEPGQRQIKSFPRRRLMEQSDLDAALRMLVSEESGAMTGTIITVDDGQSL